MIRSAFVCASVVGVASCDPSAAEPRAQLIVIVDTDMPVHDQLFERDDLSADATVDTLRVEAIPVEGPATPYDLRTFFGPSRSDWPISFGVPTGSRDIVRFRIRLFRGQMGTAGRVDGEGTVDPFAAATVDRIVDIRPPRSGVLRAKVTLRGDCIAVSSTFGAMPTTCIDGARLHGTPSDDVVLSKDETSSLLASAVGTWSGAVDVPCQGTPPEGSLCVRGGFSLLGDPAFVGVSDGYTFDSMPLLPVLSSPFFMDETEFTVGRLQTLFASGLSADEPARRSDPQVDFGEFCTWPGKGVPGDETLPVNCVTHATAEAACAARGGMLPSEAQWDHAARGRGERRLFPWGSESPSCCAVSISRHGPKGIRVECEGSGIEPVGSHPRRAECGGIGDVSRDGIRDLAGSLSESLRDWFQPFDAPCWKKNGGGALLDPVCLQDSQTILWSQRGGNWNSGSARAALPFRNSVTGVTATRGFRCVFPTGPSK